jgi:hypothetical protein
MMAKMFYTLDETRAALGKSEEDVKQLTREGRLREFRDGPRLMFKADQVEQLKAELGGQTLDHVDLGPSDSGAPIGLVDSRGASGSGIGIALSDNEGASVSGSGLHMQMKDDTALAQDLGLSGSVGGMPSPSRGGSVSGSGISMTGTGMGMVGSGLTGSGLTGSGLAGSGLGGSVAGGTAAGRGGVNVFSADDSVEHADPGAQTAITPSDQVNLEGVGSGSGLLDLTRESDDTSLGAELLDEIAPGTAKGARPRGRAVDSGDEALAEPRRGVTAPPVYVEAADPSAPAFAMMAFGATLFSLIGALVLACAIMGTRPAVIDTIAGNPADNRPIWMVFLIGVVICAVLGIIGLIAGKSARR